MLKLQILNLYDADLDTKRYRVKDLRSFMTKQKEKKIRDLAAWKKYCRSFIRIAGSLQADKKISSKEYTTCFWRGIPRSLRSCIENRIIAGNPRCNLAVPFTSGEINDAVCAILQQDQFDCAYDSSDSNDDDSSTEEDSSGDESDSDSDSDSEDEKAKQKKYSSKKKSRMLKKVNPKESKAKTVPKKHTVNGPRKEVEQLIKQMSLLACDNPMYGLAYYKARSMDPEVEKIVSEPIVHLATQKRGDRTNSARKQGSKCSAAEIRREQSAKTKVNGS